MNLARQANTIVEALREWASSEGGKAFVASDIVHMWEIAYQTTAGTRAILLYAGEDIRGDFSVAAALGRVDRKWILAITRGRGFAAQRGDSLTKTVQNARPLFDLAEEARDIIRCIRDVSVELPVDYRGIEPMSKIYPEESIVDGYMIHFTTANDLPMQEVQPDHAPPYNYT